MAKKTFIKEGNPALQFISSAATEQDEPEISTTGRKAPDGYKLNPLYVETRSKRLQLVVQPSLVQKLKARAASEGRSLNDLVHTILEEAMNEKGE